MDDLTPYVHRPFSTAAHPAEHTSFRVGEAERAAACDSLAEHYAAGRLDPAELDDRLARAMAARSQGDLRVLFVDLGPRRTVPTAAPVERPVEVPRPTTAVLPVLVSIMVVALLLAGGMLLLLGAYSSALFVAALVGGTATGVAGACAAVLARAARAR